MWVQYWSLCLSQNLFYFIFSIFWMKADENEWPKALLSQKKKKLMEKCQDELKRRPAFFSKSLRFLRVFCMEMGSHEYSNLLYVGFCWNLFFSHNWVKGAKLGRKMNHFSHDFFIRFFYFCLNLENQEYSRALYIASLVEDDSCLPLISDSSFCHFPNWSLQ